LFGFQEADFKKEIVDMKFIRDCIQDQNLQEGRDRGRWG
jgi:hypothetical protein